MTNSSKTLLEAFQVRKTKKQKEAFRAWLCGELERAGYAPRVERHRGLCTSHNVVAGDLERAELLFTAHYDTCAVLPFPNFITPRNLFWYLVYQLIFVAFFFALGIAAEIAVILLFDPPLWVCLAAMYAVLGFCVWWMLAGKANRHTANDNTSGVLTLLEIALALPPEDRDRACFVFFDNEEKGLFGSAAFAAAHPRVRRETLLLNFDCVGDGDHIHFFPSRAVKRDPDALRRLEAAFRGRGEKTTGIVTGFGFYPSDQARYRRGVGVCALKKSRIFGYYMDRIHTPRDTVLEEANIALLRDGALALAGWPAGREAPSERLT